MYIDYYKKMDNHLEIETRNMIMNQWGLQLDWKFKQICNLMDELLKYQNSKIYIIRSHLTNKVYIGSTTQTLKHRFQKHNSSYKQHYINKTKCYSSYQILHYGDAYIELLEAYPCINRIELELREGFYIRMTDNCINKCIAGRTQMQYRIENQKKIQQYRIDNREKMKQYKIDNRERYNRLRRERRARPGR